jgi:hypothetical protein
MPATSSKSAAPPPVLDRPAPGQQAATVADLGIVNRLPRPGQPFRLRPSAIRLRQTARLSDLPW